MPTIVMLPGMDGTGDLFAPIVAELDSSIAAIVVRYPDTPLGFEALIAHARQALPATGDFFLLGESFSGPVAVALAAERNPRLRGLILSAAFIRNPLPWTCPIAPLVEVAPVTGALASLLTRALLGQFSIQHAMAASYDWCLARANVANNDPRAIACHCKGGHERQACSHCCANLVSTRVA